MFLLRHLNRDVETSIKFSDMKIPHSSIEVQSCYFVTCLHFHIYDFYFAQLSVKHVEHVKTEDEIVK